jgi:hypothetical protein
MRLLTFNAAPAGNTLSWKVDADTVVRGIVSPTGGGLVSFDPAITYAAFTAPTTDSVQAGVFQLQTGNGTQFFQDVSQNLRKGDVIYMAPSSGQAVVQLLLDDIDISAET